MAWLATKEVGGIPPGNDVVTFREFAEASRKVESDNDSDSFSGVPTSALPDCLSEMSGTDLESSTRQASQVLLQRNQIQSFSELDMEFDACSSTNFEGSNDNTQTTFSQDQEVQIQTQERMSAEYANEQDNSSPYASDAPQDYATETNQENVLNFTGKSRTICAPSNSNPTVQTSFLNSQSSNMVSPPTHTSTDAFSQDQEVQIQTQERMSAEYANEQHTSSTYASDAPQDYATETNQENVLNFTGKSRTICAPSNSNPSVQTSFLNSQSSNMVSPPTHTSTDAFSQDQEVQIQTHERMSAEYANEQDNSSPYASDAPQDYATETYQENISNLTGKSRTICAPSNSNPSVQTSFLNNQSSNMVSPPTHTSTDAFSQDQEVQLQTQEKMSAEYANEQDNSSPYASNAPQDYATETYQENISNLTGKSRTICAPSNSNPSVQTSFLNNQSSNMVSPPTHTSTDAFSQDQEVQIQTQERMSAEYANEQDNSSPYASNAPQDYATETYQENVLNFTGNSRAICVPSNSSPSVQTSFFNNQSSNMVSPPTHTSTNAFSQQPEDQIQTRESKIKEQINRASDASDTQYGELSPAAFNTPVANNVYVTEQNNQDDYDPPNKIYYPQNNKSSSNDQRCSYLFSALEYK